MVIFIFDICSNSMVNLSYILFILLIGAVTLSQCVEYSSNVVVQTCAKPKHIYSEAYTNNVKCMYISVSGHIADHLEFIQSIYTDIVALYLHRS